MNDRRRDYLWVAVEIRPFGHPFWCRTGMTIATPYPALTSAQVQILMDETVGMLSGMHEIRAIVVDGDGTRID